MNLEDQLMIEMSRRNVDYIAHHIGNDSVLFKNLMDLVFTKETKLQLRASWVATSISDKSPDLLKPYIKKIVTHIDKFNHSGIRRNLLRYLSGIELPDYAKGKLYDVCSQWLLSREEPPAVKVHCMQIMFNIAEEEPDLKNELRLFLEELVDHESAAIRSRSRQLLSRI